MRHTRQGLTGLGMLGTLLILQACSGGRTAKSTSPEEITSPTAHPIAGSRARQLTFSAGDQAEPSFSPDGSRLVYQNNSDGNWELYFLDITSGESTRLTDTPENEEDPSFSPDGRWILCTVNPPTLNENPARDILLVSRDGEIRRTLVQNAADDWYPRFTPEGDAVLFVSDRADGRTVADTERNSSIFRVELESGTVTQLSNGVDDSAPCPLSGGAFLYRDQNNRLLRSTPAGDPQLQLENFGYLSAPETSPGAWVFCASENLTSPSRIWLSDKAFHQPQALELEEREADRGPSLSPDGSQLVFYGLLNEQWDLFLIRLDG